MRGLPVCPHSQVGKGLVNNFFLVLTSCPLLSADCRGATASLLFPPSHLLMVCKCGSTGEGNLLLMLVSGACYSSAVPFRFLMALFPSGTQSKSSVTARFPSSPGVLMCLGLKVSSHICSQALSRPQPEHQKILEGRFFILRPYHCPSGFNPIDLYNPFCVEGPSKSRTSVLLTSASVSVRTHRTLSLNPLEKGDHFSQSF